LISKQLYREFCRKEKNIPIYSKDWWMDAVCGENNWDVILIKDKGGNIIASMPFYIREKFGLKIITQPLLTQSNGIFIKYPERQILPDKIAYEKRIIYEVDQSLRKLHIDYYNQNHHYSFFNWQPFYWKGYKETVKYTYLIKDTDDIEKVFNNINKRKKQYIKRSEGIYHVYQTSDIEKFYELNKRVFEKKRLKIPYSFDFIKRLDKKLADHENRAIFCIDGKRGDLSYMIYLVFDDISSYLLMSGRSMDDNDPNIKSIAVWEAIKFSASKKLRFDFEGSMVEGIADFFRQFGAEPVPYHNISKAFSAKGCLARAFTHVYHKIKDIEKWEGSKK